MDTIQKKWSSLLLLSLMTSKYDTQKHSLFLALEFNDQDVEKLSTENQESYLSETCWKISLSTSSVVTLSSG